MTTCTGLLFVSECSNTSFLRQSVVVYVTELHRRLHPDTQLSTGPGLMKLNFCRFIWWWSMDLTCCYLTEGFYSASALLAMQSAVLARGILSVRPSVRPSVTFRYCVQMNEDTIVRFSASGRTIPLVSGEVKLIRIFAGDHPQRGR